MTLAHDGPPVASIDEWMGVTSNGYGQLPEDPTSEVREGVLFVVMAERQLLGGVLAKVIQLFEGWVTSTSFEPPARVLVDVRAAAFDPSGSEVRSAALKLGYLGEGKLALVVANDLQFGLGRMLGILSQNTGIEVRPFRRESDAHLWVTDAPDVLEENG